jgi:hypothetical protein
LVALAITAPASAEELGSEGGFTYVKNSSKLDDTTGGGTAGERPEAHCPNGSEPTGGGVSVSGDPLVSYVSESSPRKKTWQGGGWHTNAPAGKVTTWGVCTEKTSKVRVSSEVVNNVAGGTAGSFSVPCGQDAPVGGGAHPAFGIEEWWLNKSAPVDGGADADTKPDDAWLTSVWHQTGFIPPQPVTFDAVCMKDTKVSYKVQGVAFSTQPVVTQAIECPKKKSVVGGGPDVSGSASQVHVAKTAPFDSDDKDKVPDDGWSITIGDPSMAEVDVVVYAACV